MWTSTRSDQGMGGLTLLFVAILLISTTIGCAGEGSEQRAEVCSPKVTGEPCAFARVGVEYPVLLLSHCGVGWAYFAGRHWVIDPPQPEGANTIHGLMTLVEKNELVSFRNDERRYAFRPAPDSFSPPPCY